MNRYIVIMVTVLAGLLLPFELTAQSDAAGQPRVGPAQHILYGRLFRHVAACQRQAVVWDRMGRDGSRLRGLYQRQARISAAHSAALIAIAQDCEAEVAAYDQRAREIILAARSAKGASAGGQRQPVPPPPAELGALQQSRDKAVLRARDRLEAALGRDEFLRFESFVQSYLAPRIRPMDP
jgi:hypothetical protein